MTSTILVGVSTARPASAPTAAAGAASGLMGTIGNYLYKVTYVNGWGETEPSVASVAATTATGTMDLTAIPTSPDTNVTSRKIYRTEEGGSVYYQVAIIDDNTTTTYHDALADGDIDVLLVAPVSNTAYSVSEVIGVLKFSTAIMEKSSTVAAAGTNLATATQLVSNAALHIVTGASGTNGVKLPQDLNRVDAYVTVKNDHATNTLNVYTFDADDTINGVAGTTAYVIPAATSVKFHIVSIAGTVINFKTI